MSADRATGTVAEEAARLLEALQQAAGRWRRAAEDPRGAEHPHDDGDLPPTCRVCPFCQLLTAVQQVRPETVQHLADAAASLTAALGDLVPSGGGTPSSRPASDPAGTRARRPDDVQHIDITD